MAELSGVAERAGVHVAGRNRTGRNILTLGARVAGVGAICVIFLFPFLWMVLTSFKPTNDVFKYSFPISWKTFIPPDPTLKNYGSIFVNFGFGRSLLNSAIAAAGQIAGSVIICSLAGFGLARMRFRGRNALFGVLMITAFVPLEVIVVPLYILFRNLDLVSTYPALFLPFIFNPFGIFLMRQGFLAIPRDLDDAARVDGASAFAIFWRIDLPNVVPTLVTLALLQFVWSWNNYLWPLVVMQDPTKQVVQVSIAEFQTVVNQPLWGELFAAATTATVPLIIVFVFLQRYYVRGIVSTGLK